MLASGIVGYTIYKTGHQDGYKEGFNKGVDDVIHKVQDEFYFMPKYVLDPPEPKKTNNLYLIKGGKESQEIH